MTADTFTLRPNDEFIELNMLLKLKSIAQSGGHAKVMIADGEVKVNGEPEARVRRKLRPGDVVTVGETTIAIVAAGQEE